MSLMNYLCFVDNCGENFKNDNEIKFHIRKIHMLKTIDHYECCVRFCYKKFSTFKSFSVHLKNHPMEDVVLINPAVQASKADISGALNAPSNNDNVIPSTPTTVNVLNQIEVTNLCANVSSLHQSIYQKITSHDRMFKISKLI